MEGSGREEGPGANVPFLCISNLLECAPVTLEKRAFVGRSLEKGNRTLY